MLNKKNTELSARRNVENKEDPQRKKYTLQEPKPVIQTILTAFSKEKNITLA
ncbi:MAG: hypothetical protein ABSB32_05565 [Thermodesulfobacteriota bacterium]